MDDNHFDELTRTMMHARANRRGVVRFLTGSALVGVVSWLGLTEDAAAKNKRIKAKKNGRKQSAPAEPKAPGPLRAEGKGKGKKGKGKPKPPKPDPVCDNGLPRCPDGSCRAVGECCPGARRCEDGVCLREDKCCPGTYMCPDGSCVDADLCCPGEKACDAATCIPDNECCDITAPLCAACEEEYCNNGTWTCIPKETPICGACEEMACDNGEWVCRPTTNVSSCQQCPSGWAPCPLGPGSPFCCEVDHYIYSETTGHYYCAGAYGGGEGVWCDWF